MVRRATPTTPDSRRAQARMAVAVRDHEHALASRADPKVIALVAERVTITRNIWEAERFLAQLDAATTEMPELDEEQQARMIEILRRTGLRVDWGVSAAPID